MFFLSLIASDYRSFFHSNAIFSFLQQRNEKILRFDSVQQLQQIIQLLSQC